MATWLKQSTAVDVKVGPFVDSTDGVTPETALTITQPDIQLAKNGGAFAQKNAAQTLTHEQNGWYEVALDATDTNTLGILILSIYESGALPVWREFMVVPANTYDGLISGTGVGPRADVQGWLGTAPAAVSVAGVPEVDVTHFNGTAGTFAAGRPEVNTSHAAGTAWGSGAITAASIAADAITAAKIANGAIDAATFAAGAIDAAAIADNAIDAGAIATGAITSAKFAAGAIDAAAIATDAIGSAEFAQAAADKIWASVARTLTAATNITSTGGTITVAAGAVTVGTNNDKTDYALTAGEHTSISGDVWNAATATYGSAGSYGLLVETNIDAAISTRLATAGYTAPDNATIALIAGYTDSIEGRLPAALVGGRMDASVGAMAADVMTAAALATDAVNEIRDSVFARAFSAAYGSHTFDEMIKLFASALVGKVSGMDLNAPVFRNLADSGNVINATTDANGNRTAVTRTP